MANRILQLVLIRRCSIAPLDVTPLLTDCLLKNIKMKNILKSLIKIFKQLQDSKEGPKQAKSANRTNVMLGKCVDTDDMDNEDNLFTDVEQNKL